MFSDGSPPQTDLDWVNWLRGKLGAQRAYIEPYSQAYDSTDSTLSFAQEKFSQEFGSLFLNWRDDFANVVIDSLSERLSVQGIRFAGGKDADPEAEDIWNRNYLDQESNSAHIDALVNGASYLQVWANKAGEPIIQPESGKDMIVQYTPGSGRRDIQAALKNYWDDWGTEFCTLWTKTDVYTTHRAKNSVPWEDPVPGKNPLGIVPIVPLVNRARLHKPEPHSELHAVLPLIQAVRKVVADALVASEVLAYPQRLITGIQIPEDADGNPIPPIQSAIDRLLMFEDENVSWGAFPTANLDNYVTLVNMLVAHISVISRVPPHLFLVGASAFPSGEALATAEAGLVAKARERMIYFGDAWAKAMRMAFLVKGDKAKAEDWSARVIWADPEHRSDSMRVDALVKLNQGLGVPKRQLWEDYGYDPATIDRFDDMIKAEQEQALEHQTAMSKVMGPPMMPGQNQPDKNSALKRPQGNAGNVNRKTS